MPQDRNSGPRLHTSLSSCELMFVWGVMACQHTAGGGGGEMRRSVSSLFGCNFKKQDWAVLSSSKGVALFQCMSHLALMLYLWLSGWALALALTAVQPIDCPDGNRKKDRKGGLERQSKTERKDQIMLVSERDGEKEWEMERERRWGNSREGFLPFFFLLGSVQDSPSGERPALKRRLFKTSLAASMFACARVCACVFFSKEERVDGVSWTLIGVKNHYPTK